MPNRILLEIAKRKKFDFHIYPEALFEARIQNEMIRADWTQSIFVYLEVLSEGLYRFKKPGVEIKEVWSVIADVLEQTIRGSDVKGLLPSGTGLGVLLLDSEIQGGARLSRRLFARLFEENCFEKLSLEDQRLIIPYYIYPDPEGNLPRTHLVHNWNEGRSD
jgi:hypothetical protein